MRATRILSSVQYVVGALASIVVFAALYIFSVRTLGGQTMDQLAFDGAEFGRRSVTPFTQQLLDALPMVSVVIGVVLTGSVAAVRRNWTTLVVAVAAALAAVVTTQVLKDLLLSRPDLGVEGYAGNSFPSGHTTVAAASALAVFLVASSRSRWLAALGGAFFAIAAGVSTLANGWHRPSDVIAALLVVAIWGCVAAIVLIGLGRADAASGPDFPAEVPPVVGPPAVAYRIQLRGVVPVALVAAAAFFVTYFRAFGVSSGSTVAYAGGVTAIVAAALVIALMATRLFARLP